MGGSAATLPGKRPLSVPAGLKLTINPQPSCTDLHERTNESKCSCLQQYVNYRFMQCFGLLQGLHWTAEDVQDHQFPKLRLKVRENLVQLAGGTQQLPICVPEVPLRLS